MKLPSSALIEVFTPGYKLTHTPTKFHFHENYAPTLCCTWYHFQCIIILSLRLSCTPYGTKFVMKVLLRVKV